MTTNFAAKPITFLYETNHDCTVAGLPTCLHQKKPDLFPKSQIATTTTILFFDLDASTLVNTDTVRPGGGEKTLRSSRLPPPKSSHKAYTYKT